MLVTTLENPIVAVLTILIIPKLPRFGEKLDFAEMLLFRRGLEATFLWRLSKILLPVALTILIIPRVPPVLKATSSWSLSRSLCFVVEIVFFHHSDQL